MVRDPSGDTPTKGLRPRRRRQAATGQGVGVQVGAGADAPRRQHARTDTPRRLGLPTTANPDPQAQQADRDRPHIVVIGHVTPGEFRATLEDSDLSGGSVNRMLICLSRRSRLHTPARQPARPMSSAVAGEPVQGRLQRLPCSAVRLKFTDQFWRLWDGAYRELNRDRPDSRATEATARGVTRCCGCRCRTPCSTARTRSTPSIWTPPGSVGLRRAQCPVVVLQP